MDITLYKAVLLGHVVMAILWLGVAVALQVFTFKAIRSSDPTEAGKVGADAEFLSMRLFMPVSILAVVFGVWMVIIGPWEFSETWISMGLLGYVLTFIIGMGVIGPTSKKMTTLMGERGPQDPVVQHMIRRIRLFSRMNVVVLIAVVFDMVMKPGS